MEPCLNEDQILAFVEGDLVAADRSTLEAHLVDCVACSDLLAGAARALQASSAPSTSIGEYTLLEAIGYGGSGIIYRARHARGGPLVALKTVQMRSPALLGGIRHEIAALERLRHPGIVRVLDHGVQSGRPWYAMELLEGETLAGFARGLHASNGGAPRRAGGGDLVRVLSLARRLCEPLGYLHSQGLVHRDLKPQNVFLRPGDEPVLVDFGLTRVAPGATGREAAEVTFAAGTPAYAAPEQIRGEPVDGRADLYSLGCLLYELVTGRPPFVGAKTDDVLHQHLFDSPRPMGFFVSRVPAGLDALVLQLLAKSPSARLGQAHDVARRIDRLGIVEAPVASPVREHPFTVYRPPFVGRDAQRDYLRALVEASRDGRGGGIALVFGESGIGKTFLVNEVVRSCRGVAVFKGACLPPEGSQSEAGVLTAFHPLLEAIADRCLARGSDDADRALGPRGPVLAELLPRIRELPGQDRQPVPSVLTGVAARERLLAALRDTLALLADEQPLVFVLDDLHWADDLTVRFLETLSSDYFERHPVFVLGTCRSEEKPAHLSDLTGRPYVTSMTVGRLDDTFVGAIVAGMLGCDAPPEGLCPTLERNAEGNPFFVSEYVRAAVSSGLIERREGQWTAKLAPETWPLPRSLRDLIGSRLGGLTDGARRQCDMAAVLGHEFAAELLGDDVEVSEGIEELVSRDVVRTAEGAILRFSHHKIREIAYEQVEPSRRQALHRLAAERTEQRYGTETPGRFAWLAEQWAEGGDPRRSAHYFERAGDYSLRVGAYRQAAQMFQKALDVDRRSESSDDASLAERRAHRNLGLGHAHSGSGDSERLEEHALEALALLGWRRPRTRTHWAELLGRELAKQIVHLTVGPRLAAREQRAGLQDAALAAGLLAQRYFYLDDLVPMAAMSLLAINAAEQNAASAPIPRAYTVMGGLAGIARFRSLSARYFQSAHRAAERDLSEGAMASAVEIVIAGSLGEWSRAQATSARLVQALPRVDDPLIRGAVVSTLRHVEFYAGRYDRAEQHAVELLALGQSTQNPQFVRWAQYYLARGAVQAGRFGDAVPLLQEARKTFQAQKELQSEINGAGLLALAHLRLGCRTEARACADVALEGIARSRPTGFPSLDGYSAVAQVYRELSRGASTREASDLDRRWRTARNALWRLAAFYPSGLPAALLESSHARAEAGQWRLAKLLVNQSRRLATDFGMAPAREAAEAARAVYGFRA
jgi:tetratricopeptide (TPR) repeat protein